MERRLAAILAADIVGYSRLMEADEEGTHARLKALREQFLDPTVAHHHGRIVKLTGDGALVEFPSVVQAVQCAIEIQRGMAARNAALAQAEQIHLRIGVNLGDVIVEADDIYGGGVNVAARLEGLADPGGTLISGTAYDQVEGRLDCDFAFLGEREVKNIERPVRVYRVLWDGAPAVAPGSWARRRWTAAATAATAVALLAGGALWWHLDRIDARLPEAAEASLSLPDMPSIAVLPFDDLGGDPDQGYFADGIAEDLITDLSKVSGLFVIARNSSFRYKGIAVDPRTVAGELGVRYLLEGSVRRVGDQVRINAQLIDTGTSGHVWAERYDGSLADVFALQDRVTLSIVEALALNLAAQERQQPEQAETDVPEAYDAFLRGWEHYQKRTPEHYAKALAHFQRAVELDPDYGRAHAAIASVYWKSGWEGWYTAIGIDRPEARDAAAVALTRAMAEPTSLAHQVAAQMRLWDGRYDEALTEAEQGVVLDPSDAEGRAMLAEVLIYVGKPADALLAIETARRLDPHNQARYAYLEGFARFGLRQFEDAARLLERALELGPDLWPPDAPYRGADCDPCELLLAAYGYLGDRDGDIQVMRDRLSGTWNPYMMVVRTIVAFRPFKEPGDTERLAEGLRRAGLPEY